MAEDPTPYGRVIDITMTGAPASELLTKYVGRRAEAYGVFLPVYLDGKIAGYDPKKMSLDGSTQYFVRALPK